MTWPASIPDFTSLPDNLVDETHLQALADALAAIGDAWTSYTPTLTGWTKGDGTTSGGYRQAGKDVEFWAKFVFGSTSAASGNPTLTLPVTASGARRFAFAAGAYDTGPGTIYGLHALATATTTLTVKNGDTNLSSTAPFTWATGDEIYVSGSYEAA